MKKVKGFHFDTEIDKDVLEQIEKQGNQSQYVKDLVREDMENKDIKGLIRKELDEYMEEIAKSVRRP